MDRLSISINKDPLGYLQINHKRHLSKPEFSFSQQAQAENDVNYFRFKPISKCNNPLSQLIILTVEQNVSKRNIFNKSTISSKYSSQILMIQKRNLITAVFVNDRFGLALKRLIFSELKLVVLRQKEEEKGIQIQQ